MDFGERIKSLREDLDITREDLANKFEISYSTLSKYETNGRFPDKEMLKRFADFFNVSTDYLLCRTNDKNFGSDNTDKPTDIDDLLFKTKTELKNSNLSFSGKPASDDEIDTILQAIEMGIALAKQKQNMKNKD